MGQPKLAVVGEPLFKIEKGVPIRGAAADVYPFRDMEVGDSFLVPSGSARQARNAAYMFGARNSVKFKSRAVSGGLRVWRIA
jgi:hypothetical protein